MRPPPVDVSHRIRAGTGRNRWLLLALRLESQPDTLRGQDRRPSRRGRAHSFALHLVADHISQELLHQPGTCAAAGQDHVAFAGLGGQQARSPPDGKGHTLHSGPGQVGAVGAAARTESAGHRRSRGDRAALPLQERQEHQAVGSRLGTRCRDEQDNDATAKAWGEYQVRYPDAASLVFVKAGTGIGAGLVANGLPLRGANGAAGDIGHTSAADPPTDRSDRPLYRCGKLGCVEAYSGGWAIARDLQEQGLDCRGAEDVLRLVRAGEPLAIKLVRDAGRTLGSALAYTVSLVNPSAVVVGGTLSRTGEHLLGGIREQIAAHSLPLATRDLTIETSPMKGDSGVQGLAHMVADRVLGT